MKQRILMAVIVGTALMAGRMQAAPPRVAPIIVSCDGIPATIVGTDVADKLLGTAGPDVIVAGDGDDTIDGGGGADLICGGDGHDLLTGGAENDTLWGEDGDDMLNGGSGTDQLVGNDGTDRCDGSSGADVAFTLDCEHPANVEHIVEQMRP